MVSTGVVGKPHALVEGLFPEARDLNLPNGLHQMVFGAWFSISFWRFHYDLPPLKKSTQPLRFTIGVEAAKEKRLG